LFKGYADRRSICTDAMNQITHRLGKSVELNDEGNNARLTYRYEAGLPKPCLHPLNTDGGVCLTGFQMSDHVWHRGLWFTIKFINGENYWEEHAPFGAQYSDAEPCVVVDRDGTVSLTHEIAWACQQGSALQETRQLRIGRSDAPMRAIEWSTKLTAAKDLVLDRTPFTTWGGYGGLSFRASRELHEAKFQLPDREPSESVSGLATPWFTMNARADGGSNRRVSMGVASHPSNPRSPQPLYAKAGAMTFWNFAFLFHEPMSLREGQTLDFRYLIVVRDGAFDAGQFEAVVQAFVEQPSPDL
jgi:hypothetical protein